MKERTSMTASSSSLHGRHVLVVEDEYLIAQEIVEVLLEAGMKVVGPVPRLGDALHLVAAEERIDCAVLDVNLRGEMSWPLVDVLLARDVPVLLATGYDVGETPQAYAHLPRCEKPASGQDFTCAILRLLPDAGTLQETAP